MTTQFQVGVTYYERSLCDYYSVSTYTVASRTKCMVTLTNGKKFRVSPNYHGTAETFKPNGSYSMCAVVSADREYTDEVRAKVEGQRHLAGYAN